MSDPQIESIKEKLDILEVVQSYIGPLKKSGANHFGLCPFHNEKTPSFSVNSDLGIFKCFGCGEAGDVISFIQKMEGIDFPKALEISAKKAGVELKKSFSPQDKKKFEERDEILKLNQVVANYYHYILTDHKQGKKGREYAKSRKITKKLIEKFKIGYAPYSFNNLLDFLSKKGYEKKKLVKWGVAATSKGRVYDKFRSRLIFPLINHRGDIVGFSGRIVEKDTKAPKYLHSPQTTAFNKSKFLFGLNHAKASIRKDKFILFTEGQLDVISSHKTFVQNIVASLGTSLSEEQLKLAKRYTDNIYFCFDNDLAGESALLRSVSLAYKLDFHVEVVPIPQGQDADEFINTDKKAWEKLVKKSQGVVDHMIRRLTKRLDLSKVKGKEEFASIILPLIKKIPHKIEQDHYLQKISMILNIEDQILRKELSKIPDNKELFEKASTKQVKSIVKSSDTSKEEYLLALILQHPKFLDISIKICKPKFFQTPLPKKILEKLKKDEKSKGFSLKKFISKLNDMEVHFVEDLLLKNLKSEFETEDEYEHEIKKVFSQLKQNYYQNSIKRIKSAIAQAENNDDKEKVENLLQELVKISDKMRNT